MEPLALSFIGAGNMTRALLTGLSTTHYPPSLISISSPTTNRRHLLAERYGVISTADNRAAAQTAAVIIIAVKPQQIAAVCKDLQNCNLSDKLIISLATGVPLAYYTKQLGSSLSIIRAMPNTPASIGYAMTGLYAPEQVSETDRQFAEKLFMGVGQIIWLQQESAINTVIAAAGSAPAYFFQWMQAMQQTAVTLGISEQQARHLVQYAALGAAKMAVHNPELSLQAMSDQITAKGGTTEAALAIFQKEQFNDTIARAMLAAVQRAETLQQSLE